MRAPVGVLHGECVFREIGRDSWGSVSFDPNSREIPVRILIEREAADTPIFVARLVRDYRESGRRAELARLLDRRNDVPWYLVKPEVRG